MIWFKVHGNRTYNLKIWFYLSCASFYNSYDGYVPYFGAYGDNWEDNFRGVNSL